MRTRAHLPKSAALWRYFAVWLGGSAAVVAALALALDGAERAHPEKLELAAENGVERLGCPRVDARAEDAITLFVLASELEE